MVDLTCESPPPDPEQIEEHINRVNHGLDPRFIDVLPPNGDLANLVTLGSRQEQKFDVESETVDALMRLDLPAGVDVKIKL